MTEPAPKKRKKRRRRKGARPRQRKTGVIRVSASRRDFKVVQFYFSADVIERLVELYDREYGMFSPLRGAARYRTLRLEYARLADIGIPAVLIRIEPPTYDPHGSRIRPYGSQYASQILAGKLRLKDGIQSQALPHYWADLPGRQNIQGVIVEFQEFEMLLPPPGAPPVHNLAVESSRR